MKGIVMSKSSIVLHVNYVEEETVFLLDIFLNLKVIKNAFKLIQFIVISY
jgi:hypothetical protein